MVYKQFFPLFDSWPIRFLSTTPWIWLYHNDFKCCCEANLQFNPSNISLPPLNASSLNSIQNPYKGTDELKSLFGPIGISQHASNNPIEDRVVCSTFKTDKGEEIVVASVIDGHGGHRVAEFLRNNFVIYLQRRINQYERFHNMRYIFSKAFYDLDNAILNELNRYEKNEGMRAYRCGACCTSTVITQKHIFIANVGDCQSVLSKNGQAIPISTPHSANNPAERERLEKEHPEENVVQCRRTMETPQEYSILWFWRSFYSKIEPTACYVKSCLQPTKSFGDFHLKSPDYAVFNGRGIVSSPWTFPYIDSNPEVQCIKRNAKDDDFLILASDGIWDFLTEQQCVNFIDEQLYKNKVSPTEASSRLIEHVLKLASKEADIPVDELIQLDHKKRRKHYDDMTVCIINFRN